MSKGQDTRQQILDHAAALASRVGLSGLTIGTLARELGMSKSGLFAHFESKEGLQVAVLDHAAASFVESVVRPALATPRGLPRLRALFDLWLEWGLEGTWPGGCPFVGMAAELDDQPGPVRDHLVAQQRQWLDLLAGVHRRAVESGAVGNELPSTQFAQELYGIMLAAHHHLRLLGDADAVTRARRAFESLERAEANVPGSSVKFRPWLQDFSYGFGGLRDYDATDVRAQIDAAEDFGASGWMLWGDPFNVTVDALKPEPDS